MKRFLLCIALLIPVSAGSATRDELVSHVSDALADEYATCAAYYGIMARSATLANRSATSALHTSRRDKAIIFALTFVRKGHGEAESRALTTDKIATAVDRLFNAMDNDPGRVDILAGRHAQACEAAVEHPRDYADLILRRTTQP